MRLAVISDIHANLPALEAVLQSIDGEGVDRVVCLGDIVGYGASPNECIQLVRQRSIPCLLGNHDEVAVGAASGENFNQVARRAIEWTAGRLTSAAAEYLSGLKPIIESDGLLYVHSSPREPEKWHYLFTDAEAELSFRAFSQPVCFFGHTHFPVIFTSRDGSRRLINAGSVGQPRDRDPRACWGLYNTETALFRWFRVEYPVEQAAGMIRSAGLPDFLATRLSMGV